jgi:hypothetical protein
MLITLALLTMRASLLLAGLLTAILLPWALVKARRSLTLAAMTLAMLGMTWRGEAWKAAYLSIGGQLSPLLRPLLQSRQSSPSEASFGAAFRFASLADVPRFHFAESQSGDMKTHTQDQARKTGQATLENILDTPPVAQVSGSQACLAQLPHHFAANLELTRGSDLISPGHNRGRLQAEWEDYW